MTSTPAPPKVACVWGANGISGMSMIEILAHESHDEWSKIISISRRPMLSDIKDNRIHFLSIDIMKSSVDEIAFELNKVDGQKITHMFHYTFIEKTDANESNEVNKTLLQKALDATQRVAGKHIQCISLQTGYGYYINQHDPKQIAPVPFSEEAPRQKSLHFYYTQEDLVKEYAQKNDWNYVISRPSLIIGISSGSLMNFALNLAIYAAVQKEKGEPLVFPGSELAWNAVVDHSSSLANARFQLWSSTNKQIANQIFNIHNGDKVRFRDIWPKIEEYFGFSHYEQTFSEDKMIPNLIIPEYMPKQKEVWHQLVKRYNIDEEAFEYANWMFMHIIANLPFSAEGDLSKARQYGWTKTFDTAASYIECFDKFKTMKIIPS